MPPKEPLVLVPFPKRMEHSLKTSNPPGLGSGSGNPLQALTFPADLCYLIPQPIPCAPNLIGPKVLAVALGILSNINHLLSVMTLKRTIKEAYEELDSVQCDVKFDILPTGVVITAKSEVDRLLAIKELKNRGVNIAASYVE